MHPGSSGDRPHSGHRPPDGPLRAEASSLSRRLETLPLLIGVPPSAGFPYFQGAFLRFPANRESKVLSPLSLLGGSGGLGGSGRRRCAFLQWFACLMKKMSDMLPPPSDGPIVGRAPFRTAGRLLRAHVTSATASRAPARARPPLVAIAVSPGHYAAPFG